ELTPNSLCKHVTSETHQRSVEWLRKFLSAMMKRRTKKHFVKFAQTKNEKSMTALMERGSHTQVWCNSLRMSLTKGCRHRTKFPISVRTCQSTQKIYLKFRLDRSQNKDYEQTSV